MNTTLIPSCRMRIAAAIVAILLILIGLTTVDVRAIPNSVGAIGFINPAGMRLEDFANRREMWQAGAELKGDWEMWHDESITDSTIELLHLKNEATVFGIKANSVTLQRRDELPLQIEVTFSTAEEPRPGKLRHQLITNINAWSGGELSADQSIADHEFVTIHLGDIVDHQIPVTLRPKRASDS